MQKKCCGLCPIPVYAGIWEAICVISSELRANFRVPGCKILSFFSDNWTARSMWHHSGFDLCMQKLPHQLDQVLQWKARIQNLGMKVEETQVSFLAKSFPEWPWKDCQLPHSVYLQNVGWPDDTFLRVPPPPPPFVILVQVHMVKWCIPNPAWALALWFFLPTQNWRGA